ncbi:hypothetical protein ACR78F_14060 [Sphingobacterium spiritivorum]|nr:hypothetical protein [Sphingobacterium spiritivorum]WQD34984.1 hypothetical protein U0038_04370 [Sphingobacterium spiritivorum]SUI98821.1 Uncharacterised protein [Sphingobacterium spiritivorum]
MSLNSRKIFIGLCIVVPFLLYCVYYYSNMVKNAPYRFSDFESIVIKYGEPDHMVNEFNSKTHHYQYLDKRDSLINDTLKLRKDDLLYLHRKAMELGFWNLDDDMTTRRANASEGKEIPRYYVEYNYKDKSKKVTLDADYPGNPKMKDAAKTVVDEILKMIAEAQAR